MQVRSLGQEDALEKEMATHSSILAWRIPWIAAPRGLQSMELLRGRHDWACVHATRVLLPVLWASGTRDQVWLRSKVELYALRNGEGPAWALEHPRSGRAVGGLLSRDCAWLFKERAALSRGRCSRAAQASHLSAGAAPLHEGRCRPLEPCPAPRDASALGRLAEVSGGGSSLGALVWRARCEAPAPGAQWASEIRWSTKEKKKQKVRF